MAYINANATKSIREALKKKFPGHKFSVTKMSGSHGVDVAVMAGPAFKEESAQYDPFSPRKHKYVVSDLNKGYSNINEYWLKENYPNNAKFFQNVVEIIKTAPYYAGVGDLWFDKSDIQTDYFHTAYYMSISVGKWDKPFQVKEAA
jgi:hypothetical protein